MLLRQKTKQSRNLINNPRIYEDVANGIRNMLACASTSDRYNATFGTDDLNHGMLKHVLLVFEYYKTFQGMRWVVSLYYRTVRLNLDLLKFASKKY